MAAQALSYAELKQEVGNRLKDSGLTQAQINRVLTAFVEEVEDCLTSGYSVSVPGLFKAVPQIKEGRKRGTVVRNPFDGTSKTLRADEPDKFVVKIKKSSALANKFPSLRTNDGKELAKALSKR